MTDLMLIAGALAGLALCGYLAACAGGQRWLTLGEWLGRRSGGVTTGELSRNSMANCGETSGSPVASVGPKP